MAQIFLSYSADDRARVRPLVQAFGAAGLSVWWDREIGAGASFDLVIERELDAAACVVVVWTENSVGSQWVRNEATEGLDRDALIPVLLDRVKPPLAFRRCQAVDLVEWSGQDDESFRRLLTDIRRRIGDAPRQLDQDAPSSRGGARSEPAVVAVLPLADRTAERNMAYLCDGLAEDLMNALFSVSGLRILAARDTFAYRDTHESTRQIGQALHATAVLEGSVQRAGNQIAISMRLVDVASGVSIYAERFVRELDDVFAVQSDIARHVVAGLRGRLGPVEMPEPSTEGASREPLAYRAYQAAQGRGDADTLVSIAALESAIALDPRFERAYAELAIAYIRSSNVVTPHGAVARAKNLLAQLQRFKPDSPAAWAIEVELESDMRSLARRSAQAIARGERVHPYPHPTGWHDARAAFARALAHSGLYREGYEYFALLDRRGEPNRFDNWLHQLGCLVALGEFAAAMDHARRMRKAVTDPGELVSEWEFVALIAMGDVRAAEKGDIHSSKQRARLVAPVLDHLLGRPPSAGVPREGADWEDTEMAGYRLLATGTVDAGLELLDRSCATADTLGHRHWLSFRLPIYRFLFASEVHVHPEYRRIVSALGLDPETRAELQQEVADLSGLTGIVPAPLTQI